MKLTDIREKITEQLAKLTIDDFYSSPNIAELMFSKITNIEVDKIESYLMDRFPETRVEALRYPIEQSIATLKKQIPDISKAIKSSKNKINKIDKEIAQNQKRQDAIPKQQEKTKNKLLDIETEINQIKPLAGKTPYDKQIKELESEKKRKKKELESYSVEISTLKTKSESLQENISSIKETLLEDEANVQFIQEAIKDKECELKSLKKKEDTHYNEEYSSLEFLFKILLQENIYISSEEDCEEIKTGRITLDSDYCSFSEVKELIFPYLINDNEIPKGWRNILYKALSNPIKEFAGVFSKTEMNFDYLDRYNHTENYYYLFFNDDELYNRNKLELTSIDISTLLATKIALKSNYSIRIEDNKIALALSGGIIAKIVFRKKGNLIKEKQEHPFEIFIKPQIDVDSRATRRFIQQTLYYQKGYADSEIQIKTPYSYYVLTDNFVIEIEYISAPILFDNNCVIKSIPNISGKAKRKDEIVEQEEEDRRRQEEDDYWDDDDYDYDWDDDDY